MATEILRIITRLNIGGPARTAINLTKYIENTKLIYGKEDKYEGNMLNLMDDVCKDRLIQIKYLQRNISPIKDILAFFKIYTLIRKEKPIILHTHLSKAGVLGRLAGRICKVKYIYHTFHGHVFDGYFPPVISKIILLIERILARWTTKLIVVSNNIKKDLIRYKICSEDKIVVIPQGLDLERYKDCKNNTILREKLKIPPSTKVIATVTRLVPIKRVDIFLEAAKIVSEYFKKNINNINVVFLVVGDGELKDDLKALANKLGIITKLYFIGFYKNLEEIYGIIDVFVLSSDNEGLPTALLEAQASGSVVVARDVGGVAEALNKESSILVKSNSKEELAHGIIKAILDTSLQEKAKINKIKVIKEYSLFRLITNIKNLYYNACKNSRK